MAVTVEEIEDKYEIVGPHRIVQIRTVKIFRENGVEVGRTYHRKVAPPDANPINFSPFVQSLMSAAHTPEIKSAYLAADRAPPEES